MEKIAAFVGHSFDQDDADIVRQFLNFFDKVKDLGIGFEWDHAEAAETKNLAQKVHEKMQGKNLFIGICTSKEYTIDPEKLSPTLIRKNVLKTRKESLSFKTSDWIIQEIGFSVGRGMDIMLLLEVGLREPGGLQGDLEYIRFDRNAPEKSFPKILEMLRSLRPPAIEKETGFVKQSTEKEEDKEADTAKVVKELTPNNEWTYKDYSFSLGYAIFINNKDKEKEIFEKYLEMQEAEGESAQIRWRAEYAYKQYLFRNEDMLDKLKDYSAQNPSEPKILTYVGRIYESYKQHELAGQYFEQASELYSEKMDRLNCVCSASIAYKRHGNTQRSEDLLEKAKDIAISVSDGDIILLRALATISECEKDDDSYVAFNEALLNREPDDHNRRFSLALKYSELGEEDLALYHYKIHTASKPTEASWNNRGVAEGRLQLPSESISSYRESEKLGGTLAISNMAHELIKSGFLDEAQALCDRAIKIKDYDKQIGTAIVRIKNTKKDEENREKEIIEKIERRRVFYANYSLACTRTHMTDFDGEWKGPDGNVVIKITERQLEGLGSIEKKSIAPTLGGLLGSPGLLGRPVLPSPIQVVKVRYSGMAFGHAVKYKKWVEGMGKESSTEGLLFFSDDLLEINVYEKGNRTTEKFYKMTKNS